MSRFLLMNIGCIECGVSSNVVGVYASKELADKAAELCGEHLHWREGGQNSFEVFDLREVQAGEYREVLLPAGLEPLTDNTPKLLSDLTDAAAQLRKYETLHRAKGTPDSPEKAEVNAALAARFEATIAAAVGGA
ncbi:MAG: hypothetical protein RSE94_01995 [Pseudomonas sp.]